MKFVERTCYRKIRITLIQIKKKVRIQINTKYIMKGANIHTYFYLNKLGRLSKNKGRIFAHSHLHFWTLTEYVIMNLIPNNVNLTPNNTHI